MTTFTEPVVIEAMKEEALKAIAAFPDQEPMAAFLKKANQWSDYDHQMPPYVLMARVARIASEAA